VFVRHDLASDPPFSRLDLITCRNVLIYFDQRLQKRILSTFHYCLNQPGFLLLGRTENVSSHQQLFFIEDKVNKIFSRTAVASQLKFSISKAPPTLIPKHIDPVAIEIKPTLDLAKTIDNLLLNEYAPCGVLVNERLDVLQFRGRTSLFIEQPPGQPEANLLKIAREGLFVPIKMLLAKAKKDLKTVRKDNVQVKQNGKVQLCNVIVMPVIKESTVNEQYFLVLFEEKKNVITSKGKKGLFKKLTKKEIIQEERRSTTLEKELEAIKEYLQSLNLEHQKTNDALATANEEFVSGNEELQSMNEELETAKEELQSTNEELHTVNDELQNRNQEVGQANNDLVNLLNSVEIPILILDLHRRIRRFTPHARTIMNLLPGDIGRSIDDIRPNITVQDLDKKIDEVISSNKVLETEVQDGDGRWHNIQIRPYKTLENKIDGVVLSLVDINKLRRAVSNAEWARDYATSIVEAMQIPLVVLDKKLM
jgi:two-component system CheB/CheR fusion protein